MKLSDIDTNYKIENTLTLGL